MNKTIITVTLLLIFITACANNTQTFEFELNCLQVCEQDRERIDEYKEWAEEMLQDYCFDIINCSTANMTQELK